jgi:hypothetical protein
MCALGIRSAAFCFAITAGCTSSASYLVEPAVLASARGVDSIPALRADTMTSVHVKTHALVWNSARAAANPRYTQLRARAHNPRYSASASLFTFATLGMAAGFTTLGLMGLCDAADVSSCSGYRPITATGGTLVALSFAAILTAPFLIVKGVYERPQEVGDAAPAPSIKSPLSPMEEMQ